MYQSTRSFSILSPGQPPGQLNFSRLACSNSSPSGQKSRSNAPPISTEIPPLKDKFHLQSNTVHAFQRDICRNNTFKLLLKTLLKELFANKGEILSCKSVKSCKNRKKLSSVLHCSTLEQEINPVQIPHPSKATFKFPLPGHDAQSKAQGMPGGGGC